MGRTHSIAYAILPSFFPELPSVRRKVVVDVTEDLARRGAQQFGFDEWATNWKDAVARPDIDIVDIVTPNDSHQPLAHAALAAGKHVLCEKPLALTAAQARAMADQAERSKGIAMVVFNYRRAPAVMEAKRLIESGAIGEILTFRGLYLQDWAMPEGTPWSWRFSAERAGSGSLGDIGSHVLDIASFLVGDIVAVAAAAETFVPERPLAGASGNAAVDVDDCTIALLRFHGGAIGTLEASRFSYGRKNHLSFEISGTKGALTFNWERSNELNFYSAADAQSLQGFRTIVMGPANPGGNVLWPIPGIGTGYIESQVFQVGEFVRAIVQGQDGSSSFAHGYRIQAIMEAIATAARNGAWAPVSTDATTRNRGGVHAG
ncbi:MAG: Gfo/Idh/MocA family oxidoreductase [Hyphomicrobiales bacterium]|nr:Gfo/Idh/MocA family oxidoreductase [Hyphomicrobiales bacterium]